MYKIPVLLISIFIVAACNNNASDKVTYYEPHDNCELMRIMDSSMAPNKIALTGDDDYDLATILKVQISGGVQMAMYENLHGKDYKIKAVAKLISSNSTKLLAAIDSFQALFRPQPIRSSVGAKGVQAMEKMQRSADLQLIKDNDDYDFAILLLPQRQAGIDIAELIMHYGRNDKLKALAAQIKEEDEKEITQLQQAFEVKRD